MNNEILIEKNKLLLTSKALCLYLGVSKGTISDYKNKGLESYHVDGYKAQYFNLKETEEFRLRNIKDKHSPKKPPRGEEEQEEGEHKLVDGRRLYELDMNNSEDLELLAMHPLGDRFIDTLKGAEDIKTKQHALKVKRGEYLLVQELNVAIAEILALVKNTMVVMRDQLPITQTEKLIELKTVKSEDKITVQELISDEADKYMEDSVKDIRTSMLKRVPKARDRAIRFLENLIEYVKESYED